MIIKSNIRYYYYNKITIAAYCFKYSNNLKEANNVFVFNKFICNNKRSLEE